jgi:hypothetical protein
MMNLENRICPHGMLEIRGVQIRCMKHYDETENRPKDPETDAQYMREEDEYAAQELIARFVVTCFPDVPEQWKDQEFTRSWQALLMTLYKPIARHYKVDPDTVLHNFNRHYLPSLIAKHVGEREAIEFMNRMF